MKRMFALLILPFILAGAAECANTPDVSAKSAVLLDAASGRVIFEKNADTSMLIASTTKIMTALTAIELCDMDCEVLIGPEAAGVEGSSMYLQAGQTRTCSELLHGLMLMSGNDAAVALAIHCGGSVEGFVEQMNKKAQSLGLSDTYFENPHGLDGENHRSTAKDMARLTAAAMSNEKFAAIVSKRVARVGEISVRNHNRLLWMIEGCDGVKTGFTKKAGRCLVSSTSRDGCRIIAVTLDAPSDWSDHQKLVAYGFSEYSESMKWKKGEQIAEIPVFSGEREFMPLIIGRDLNLCFTESEMKRAVVNIEFPHYLWAPVSGGSTVGRITVTLDGKFIGETDVITKTAVY